MSGLSMGGGCAEESVTKFVGPEALSSLHCPKPKENNKKIKKIFNLVISLKIKK
jgi:hypothetical protein